MKIKKKKTYCDGVLLDLDSNYQCLWVLIKAILLIQLFIIMWYPRLQKPGTDESYTFQDLYVGALIFIYGRCFELLEADEYTYMFMENNRHAFVMVDLEAITKILLPQVRGGKKITIYCNF